MTTYICKCGRTFQKSTNAATTAYKMPEYGPEHECYGCPFVQTEKWKEPVSSEITDVSICRGSQKISYQTTAHTAESKGSALHVHTMDLDFINEVLQFYLTLDGHAYDRLQYGMDDEEGTRPYSFYFEANKKGEAAKNALIDRFFQPDGKNWEFTGFSGYFIRKDVTPEQEKEIVLNQIRIAKEEAQSLKTYYAPCGHKFNRSAGGASEITVEVTGSDQGCSVCHHVQKELRTIAEGGPRLLCVCSWKKVMPADTPITLEEPVSRPGARYFHNGLVYFAGRREDNGKYTAFMNDADYPADPNTLTTIATIPDFDTLEEAQNALDGLAKKRGFMAEGSDPAGVPEAEQPDDDPDDLGPDGMEELAEYQELTQPDAVSANDAPESGNDGADSEDGADETPDPGDDTTDSANDDAEQPPCDWKNASGADDDEDEQEANEEAPAEVSGDPPSLRGHECDEIISAADKVLNRLIAMLHAKKQHDGEMTIKVTFEDDGFGQYIFGGAVSGKINYTIKPQKISGEPIELKFDAEGNPIIPADRERQLSFADIPPAGGTATVDGKTGIVEHYQEGRYGGSGSR